MIVLLIACKCKLLTLFGLPWDQKCSQLENVKSLASKYYWWILLNNDRHAFFFFHVPICKTIFKITDCEIVVKVKVKCLLFGYKSSCILQYGFRILKVFSDTSSHFSWPGPMKSSWKLSEWFTQGYTVSKGKKQDSNPEMLSLLTYYNNNW